MAKKKAVSSKAMGGISKDLLKQLGGMLAEKAGLPADIGSMLAGQGAKALGLKKGGKVHAKARGGYAGIISNIMPTPAEMGANALGFKKGGKIRAKGRGGYARGGRIDELSPGVVPNVMPTPVRYPIGYDRSQMYARGGEVSAKPGQIMMKGGKMVRAKGIGGQIGGLLGNLLMPGVGGILGGLGGDALGSVFGFKKGGRVGKQVSNHTAF